MLLNKLVSLEFFDQDTNEIVKNIKMGNVNYSHRKTYQKIFRHYHTNFSNIGSLYVEFDMIILKYLSKELGLSKNKILKWVVDDKLYFFIVDFFAKEKNIVISYEYLKLLETDLELRTEFSGVSIDFLLLHEKYTLKEIGDLNNLSKERIRQLIQKCKDFYIAEYERGIYLFSKDFYTESEIENLSKFYYAFFLANKAHLYNEELGLYILDPIVKREVENIKNLCYSLQQENNQEINQKFEEYKYFLNLFVMRNSDFYTANDRIFSIVRDGIKKKHHFILNYCDEQNLEVFSCNQEFIDDFKSTVHGQLYYQFTTGELNIHNVESLLLRNEHIIKISTHDYYYDKDNKLLQCIEDNYDYYYQMISDNIPFENIDAINTIQKNSQDWLLSPHVFYYTLKKVYNNYFNISNYTITSLVELPISDYQRVRSELENNCSSTLESKNMTHIKNKFKKCDDYNDYIFYGQVVYNIKNIKIVDELVNIKCQPFIDDVYTFSMFVDKLRKQNLDLNEIDDSDVVAFKIWSIKNNLYNNRDLSATKEVSLQEVFWRFFQNYEVITEEQFVDFTRKINYGRSVNFYNNYFQRLGIIEKLKTGYKINKG